MTHVIHTGRNDPCPCGSGKKFKKCCLQEPHVTTSSVPDSIMRQFEDKARQEQRRRDQFGDTNRMMHADHQGYKIVAVGNELHYSNRWRTFPDFLFYYILTSP